MMRLLWSPAGLCGAGGPTPRSLGGSLAVGLCIALGWWPLDGLGGLFILYLSVKLLHLGADFFSADLLVSSQVGYVVFSMAWGLGLLVLCGVLALQ